MATSMFARPKAAGAISMFELPCSTKGSSTQRQQNAKQASALVFSLPVERVDKESVASLLLAVRQRATSLSQSLHEVQALEQMACSKGVRIHGSLLHEGGGSRSKGGIMLALRRSAALEGAVSSVLHALGRWPALAVQRVLRRHAAALTELIAQSA